MARASTFTRELRQPVEKISLSDVNVNQMILTMNHLCEPMTLFHYDTSLNQSPITGTIIIVCESIPARLTSNETEQMMYKK